MADKRRSTATATVTVGVGGDSLLEMLLEGILSNILLKLEQETLCSLACISRTLQSSIVREISSYSSVDLSAFSPDPQTFDGIRRRFGKIKKITLDCLRLTDSSISSFLGPDVEELVLLKCSSLSYKIISSIGKICPNLRVLTLEFSGGVDDKSALSHLMLGSIGNCLCLESLKVKVRVEEINDYAFMFDGVCLVLPRTVKVLKFEPTTALATVMFFRTSTDNAFGQTLTHLSLVLDIITDDLLSTIAHNLPLLVELDLKDRPTNEPSDDLSNFGVQSLVNCKHLTNLSLIRSRQHITTSFKRTTDMGMFLLSEGCKGLESVRLGGFSKVTDAGFTSILDSCLKLKKFEIQNASLLTDLAFQDVGKAPRSLVEVKLVSCGSITSEAVRELATCGSLEVLDLLGCRSVADSCLSSVSRLTFLTYLNIGGSDVTNAGMAILGSINAPITCLSLRGCKRVTDNGISFLFKKEEKISKNLSFLDLGHMPGITDNGITTVADTCVGITELCVRYCFHITDASVRALALKGRLEGEGKLLRRLDLYNCTGLSVECCKWLKKPLFRGLQWIGIGRTCLTRVGDAELGEIERERRWLFICGDGCEVGCHDGWQFHKF